MFNLLECANRKNLYIIFVSGTRTEESKWRYFFCSQYCHHEIAHLIAAKLVCYANSLPYTAEQNIPTKLGTKRTKPIQGDAGNFIEEFLFWGRIIPKDKILILEAEDYSSALPESFSISNEWISKFANALHMKNFEKRNFTIPPTALAQLSMPSQEQFSIDDELEEEELESYKFAPNCLRRSS